MAFSGKPAGTHGLTLQNLAHKNLSQAKFAHTHTEIIIFSERIDVEKLVVGICSKEL